MSTTPQKVYSDFGEKICRFCGGAKDHCTNIFGISGERKKISDKASEVLNISIREEDGLQNKICRPCEGALDRFSEFKKMVIDTQNQLKSKVLTKRCKVFSPAASAPEKKLRVMEEKTSSARSLPFNNHSKSSVPQATSEKALAKPISEVDSGEKSGYTILSQAGLKNPEVR